MESVPSGRYEILEPIGSGGMAELFLASTRGPQGFVKLVVIKRILSHLARDAGFVEMFLNEARIAATLDHPNLVSVLDFGQREGDYFLTMEYVHGADLGTLLDLAAARGDLPLDVALHIVQGACAGLHHAHERTDVDGRPLGLVHRDVSPSNVMISDEGHVQVTDFGIATATALTRATRAGTLKGKVSYMSPEQCKGARLDRRADVFALGILLYETTLLSRLFVADNDYALMNQVIEARIPPPRSIDPSYPEELERIVLRALAADPDDRFATAADLQAALEQFAAQQGILPSPRAVSQWVERQLGHRPYPTIARSPPAASASPPAQPGRHAVYLWSAAGLLIAGSIAAALSTATDPPTQNTSRSVAPTVATSPVGAPPAQAELEPGAAARAESEDEILVFEFEEPSRASEDERGPASSRSTGSPRRKRSRRPRRGPSEESAQPSNLDAAAPPK